MEWFEYSPSFYSIENVLHAIVSHMSEGNSPSYEGPCGTIYLKILRIIWSEVFVINTMHALQ